MKIIQGHYKTNQGILPLFISDFLDISDPVLVFDKFMEGIDCSKYLKNIPVHETGRIRYNPVNMLKTVIFGFMTNGYISLRELEDNCKVNLRFMYLMNNQKPSYRTFGYFINEVLGGSIKDIFVDINKTIFKKEHVDLNHLYIDGTKLEANANKHSWVWKKATEKSRYGSYNNYIYCEEKGMEKYMKFPMFKKETTDEKYHNNPFRAINFKIDEEGIMRCPNNKAFHFKYR